MKIIALTAENVKKLVAVEIRPDGNVVQITGKNGQGKTSVLDCIWWALAGATHIQSAPIRKGATEARISLDLGEITVTRAFKKRDDEKITTSITVENDQGARFPSPQRMLDGLLGELSFDPLAFARMDARQQFNELKRFVPDVDFEAIADANRDDYAKRTEVNRAAKQAKTMADQIDVDAAVADQAPIDESALLEKLQSAADHNSQIETRKVRREQAREAADAKLRESELHKGKAAELREQADDHDAQARALVEEAKAIDKKIDDAPPLPDPIDTDAVRVELEAARQANAQIDQAKRKAALLAEAEEADAQSKALTKAMEDREQAKRDTVANAELPVPALAFGDGEIMLDGVPFDQASDAERLRTSIAIAMASNPKLRVIRVRDGSLLDEEAMRLVSEMADGNDYQVWIERVDDTGKIGFVLEDGRLKGEAEAQTEAAE